MVESQDEPNNDPDASERTAERAEMHFLAALTDELMRTLMASGVLTQAQLNEIEQAVANRTGNLPRAW
jgi:hypothetical protein